MQSAPQLKQTLMCRSQTHKPVLVLKAAEARWASSALFSCAMQLNSGGLFQSAEPMFRAACEAASSSMVQLTQQGAQTQVSSLKRELVCV